MNTPNVQPTKGLKSGVLKLVTASMNLALAATVLAASASASSQVLTEPGLNSDTQPLLPFTQPTLDRWMQENAVLVTGTQGDGAMPFAGDGMVRLSQAGLAHTEVRQRLDVSGFAATIDAGIAAMETRAMINPSIAGVTASVQAWAYNGSQASLAFITSSCQSPDGDLATWEESVATLMLPPGTRFVEIRMFAVNSTLPTGEFLYVDEAQCNLFEVLDPQALTDPGLDSSSQALLGFTQPTLDRWMQENAVLVTGTQGDGAAPYAGDGMVRLATASLSLTEVRQRVDVSSQAAIIDAGLASMEVRGMVNPSVSGVNAGVLAFAFNASQGQVGFASSACNGRDGDTATWEQAVATLKLPVGTRFVELRFFANNSTLPTGEFLYADGASLALKAAPVCFTDVCPGLAGTFGAPLLSAQVSLGPNAVGNLLLSNALQNTPAALFVGLGPAGAGVPFKGGTLKPVPWILLLTGLTTDTAGEIGIPLNIGLGAGGFSIVFQYGILDGAAINGISLSNALQMDLL